MDSSEAGSSDAGSDEADPGEAGRGDAGSSDAGSSEVTLPARLTLQRTTPTFDEESVPAGLLRAHQVAEHVWGRVVVQAGSIGFVFEDAPDEVRTVVAGETQVIPPARPHHVVIQGRVRFAVEFYRR